MPGRPRQFCAANSSIYIDFLCFQAPLEMPSEEVAPCPLEHRSLSTGAAYSEERGSECRQWR
eukprot:scaffold30_cov416-Prasinococcus_capsulatus_cf.AAC.31